MNPINSFWFCYFVLMLHISGPPSEAGALTVDLDAASEAFDQMLAVPWIKQSVKTFELPPCITLFCLRRDLRYTVVTHKALNPFYAWKLFKLATKLFFSQTYSCCLNITM